MDYVATYLAGKSAQEQQGGVEEMGAGGKADPTDRSDQSDLVRRPTGLAKRLRPSGGYRTLRSFRVTTIIYDGTVSFCDRFVDKRSRTHDQMVQSARSGRQNIAEGSRAAATSSQTELRLVNVARASLDELLLDYEDFLRQRSLQQWAKDAAEAREVRTVANEINQTDRTDPSDQTDLSVPYARWLTSDDPAVVANALICLIHQANYLLHAQITRLERDFVHEGGYSEQLAAARIKHRGDQPERTGPACPQCGGTMAVRTAHKGPHAGEQFWGCCGYPHCRGTRKIEESDRSV